MSCAVPKLWLLFSYLLCLICCFYVYALFFIKKKEKEKVGFLSDRLLSVADFKPHAINEYVSVKMLSGCLIAV